MGASDLTRRGFVERSLSGLGATIVGGALPLSPPQAGQGGAGLRVLCIGAHPDDPESGCGGTLVRYASLGHAVTVLYLTRGERGIDGTSLDDAAAIRTAESAAACRILDANPKYFGQIDGATEVTAAQVEAMRRFFAAERPDVVFTHWPVDTHMDHQVASLLTIRAWMATHSARLYFYEVNSGSQTQGFLPNTYVDISSVVERKKVALFAHTSQDGQGIWREHHALMAQWRGREAGVAAAEAFVHLTRDARMGELPGR
jgi:LmbE family N-acetylglucosaminyl deacetylase